ncbi:caspase, EACC1-associated type [Nocardia africana]
MIAPPDRTGWRAALIGVSRYTNSEITDIPAAANNVEDLAGLLIAPTGASLAQDQCTVLVDPDRPSQVGELVARTANDAEDVLLVYYTGHGLLDRRGRLHLALSGSDPDQPQWSSIPYATLRDELAASRARARILILDCCFSGRAFEAMSAPSTVVSGQIDIDGTYTIASSARNRTSLAPEGDRNTAFTAALLAAAATTGLTLDQLYSRADEILHHRGYPRPQRRSVNVAGALRLFTPPGSVHAPLDDALSPVVGTFSPPTREGVAQFKCGQQFAADGDDSEAEKCWRTAASEGHAGAMNNLANRLLAQGKAREAHKWYLESAQRGNPDAMGNLADLLFRVQEATAAENWWRRAAEFGNADAMYHFALKLDKTRNYNEAITWYGRAAEAGHKSAMHNLAIRLRYRGEHDEAATWWNGAGHKRAQRATEKLRGPAKPRYSNG